MINLGWEHRATVDVPSAVLAQKLLELGQGGVDEGGEVAGHQRAGDTITGGYIVTYATVT